MTEQPPASLSTGEPDPSPRMRQDAQTNVKDTIQSILIAFILAFMFRAFVVEAFVIPTGSMAPTLLGAHMRFTCEDCGYRFDANYPTGEGDRIDIHPESQRVYSLRCPNCGFKVPRTNPADALNAAANTPTRYGDRILVLKYVYLLNDPTRWDVVVFKTPDRPEEYDYSQNYIKRLLGLPGESVMILDGDCYTADGSIPLSQLRPVDFKIQRKPRYAQQALWRVVYDNDHLPRCLPRAWVDRDGISHEEKLWEQPWKPAPGQRGWDLGPGTAGARTFRFDNLTGSAEIFFSPDANPRTNAFTDWLMYDSTFWQNSRDNFSDERYVGDNNVSDTMLEFHYRRHGGEGMLRVELTKLDHRLVVELGNVSARLLHADKVVATCALPAAGTTPRHVELANVDYGFTLLVDGVERLKYEYAPDVSRLIDAFESRQPLPKPSIRIAAENQVCELSHLRLWRDVYYGNRAASLNGGQPTRWASPANFPERVAKLNAGEFFVCGDNSPLSGDAREWSSPINLPLEGLNVESGRVPERFMLGRAFFVYWPAGYRPLRSAPAITPNFADMRFIK